MAAAFSNEITTNVTTLTHSKCMICESREGLLVVLWEVGARLGTINGVYALVKCLKRECVYVFVYFGVFLVSEAKSEINKRGVRLQCASS